jgi:glycerol-3-phosphate dehydrogenase (NAD(P)+)
MTTTTERDGVREIDETDARRVAVLGGGRMGEAVGTILAMAGAAVTVWEINDERRQALARARPMLKVAAEIGPAIEGAGTVFFAVPGPAFVDVARAYAPFARGDHVVLHGARGVCDGFQLPHQIVKSETCAKKIGVLGGPLYFADAEHKRPLFVVIASRFDEVVARTRALVHGTPIRLHPARDVVGVEVAGAISNVTAIATGIADGLSMGETARGVLAARGLSEATRLGLALGAELSTFGGLAGVGDLIPRKVSSTERHNDLGRRVASGENPEEVVRAMAGAVEGVMTAREARKKARAIGLDLPLIEGIVRILDEGASAYEVLDRVLSLDLSLGRELASP